MATVKALVLSSLLLLLPQWAPAQEQLSVDLSESLLYTLIVICSLRGTLALVSAVKPYRYRQVRELLQGALDDPKRLSAIERSLLRRLQDRRLPPAPKAARLEASAASSLRANLSAPTGFHSVNQAGASLRGPLGESVSYNLNLALLFDKVDPQTFPPYAYTKDWDGFYI